MLTSSSFRLLLAAFAASLGAALVITAAPAAHAQFLEDFNGTPNNGNPATFGNDTGGFFVNNGAYQSSLAGVVQFSTIVAPGYTNLTDATLTFDLLNARDSGAVLRSDANADNAVALIVRPSLGDLYLIQRSSGAFVFTQLGLVNISGIVTPGSSLRVTFSSSGDSFSASVADLTAPNTVLASTSYTFAPNTVPSSGRAGLYQYSGASSASLFDNVGVTTVNPAAAPEPGTLALLLPAAGSVGLVIARRRKAAQ